MGASYQLQLLTLKGQPRAKRLRIIPASRHDIRLTVHRNQPAEQHYLPFFSSRFIHNGRLYLTTDPDDIPPAEKEPHTISALSSDGLPTNITHAAKTELARLSKTNYTQNTTDNLSSGITTQLSDAEQYKPVMQISSAKLFPKTANNAQLNATQRRQLEQYRYEIQLMNRVSQLLGDPQLHSSETVKEAFAVIPTLFNILPIQDILRSLLRRAPLFGTQSLAGAAPPAEPELPAGEHITMADILREAMAQNDWNVIEAMERVRIRGLYMELHALSAFRTPMLAVLFEPRYRSALDNAYQAFDYRTLQLLQCLVKRRLWRGVLFALDTYYSQERPVTKTSQICERLVIPLYNGTKLELDMDQTRQPSALASYNREVWEETMAEYQLLNVNPIAPYNLSGSDLKPLRNTWLVPYCETSTEAEETGRRLNEWAELADPASVLGYMLRPLFQSAHPFLLHALLLREVVQRFPSIMQPQETSEMLLGESWTTESVSNTNAFTSMQPSMFTDTTQFLQFLSRWWRIFLNQLAEEFANWVFIRGVDYPAAVVPNITLRGCVPNVIDYLVLRKGTYRAKWAMRLQPDRQASTPDIFPFPRLQIFLEPKSDKRFSDREPYGDSNLIWLKQKIQRWVEPWTIRMSWLMGHPVTLPSEHIELVVSSFLVKGTPRSSASRVPVGRSISAATNWGVPGKGICLTITDVFGFSHDLANFFELVQLQQLATMQEAYARETIQINPALAESSVRTLFYFAQPLRLFSGYFGHFARPFRCANQPREAHRSALWTSLENRVLHGSARLPQEFREHVEKWMFYTDILLYVKTLGGSKMFGLHPTPMRFQYSAVKFRFHNSTLAKRLYFLSSVTDGLLQKVALYMEDIQRLTVFRPSVKKPGTSAQLETRATPLWDVIQLQTQNVDEIQPLVTFMIDERDPHSYFFKGRQTRYEPNVSQFLLYLFFALDIRTLYGYRSYALNFPCLRRTGC